MKIRLRGKRTEPVETAKPAERRETAAAAALDRQQRKRQFLKLLATGAGLAGVAALGQMAAPARRAEATYTPGPTVDTVDHDLQVNGNLIVPTGNVGIGVASPSGVFGQYLALEAAGSVQASGYFTIKDFDGAGTYNTFICRDGSMMLWHAGNGLVVGQYGDGATPSVGSEGLVVKGNVYLAAATGSVGIGTAMPAIGYVLHAVGNVFVQGLSPVLRLGLPNDNFRPAIYAYTTDFATDTLALAINDVQGTAVTPSFNSARVRLISRQSDTADSICFDIRPVNGSYTTKVAITTDGNLKVNGSVAIDSSGVAKKSYYDS